MNLVAPPQFGCRSLAHATRFIHGYISDIPAVDTTTCHNPDRDLSRFLGSPLAKPLVLALAAGSVAGYNHAMLRLLYPGI
jgi:hypothetical protein